MKKSKKFLSMLLAISMILAMSVTAFAAAAPNPGAMPLAESGRLIKNNEAFTGNNKQFKFTLRSDEHYFRVAVRNDMNAVHGNLNVTIYEGSVSDSNIVGSLYATPGQWTAPSVYEGTPGETYYVVITAAPSAEVSGVISIRAAAVEFSRTGDITI